MTWPAPTRLGDRLSLGRLGKCKEKEKEKADRAGRGKAVVAEEERVEEKGKRHRKAVQITH